MLLKDTAKHVRQATLELLSASFVSTIPVIAVLSDFQEYWDFLYVNADGTTVVREQFGAAGSAAGGLRRLVLSPDAGSSAQDRPSAAHIHRRVVELGGFACSVPRAFVATDVPIDCWFGDDASVSTRASVTSVLDTDWKDAEEGGELH